MSRKGISIKTQNNSTIKQDEDVKDEKDEKSLEMNSYSVSEQKINDNINIPKLIKNDESLILYYKKYLNNILSKDKR